MRKKCDFGGRRTVFPKKTFIEEAHSRERGKVFRRDDISEIPLWDNMRANQEIVDELTAIKTAISLLIIYVFPRLQNTAKIIAEMLFLRNKATQTILNNRISGILNFKLINFRDCLLETLKSSSVGAFDHKTAVKKYIGITPAKGIHFGKVFSHGKRNVIISVAGVLADYL